MLILLQLICFISIQLNEVFTYDTNKTKAILFIIVYMT